MAIDSLTALRSDCAAWLRLRWRELGLLALLWLAASVVLFVLADRYVTPRRYHDEFFYWGIAKSIAAGHGLSWRGSPVELRSFLYPLYIAPVFRLAGSVPTQYTLVHAFNAVAACAVVFPTYLMARSLASHRWSLAAAVFALCLPAINYSGIIGTESLAYPVCAAALAAILLVCRQPRPRNLVLACAAIVLAVLVRTQFVVLPVVLVLAILLTAAFRGRGGARKYLRSQWLVAAVAAVVVIAAVTAGALAADRIAGIYAGALHQSPHSVGELWFWLRSFAADSVLLCGIVPAIAAWALLGSREQRRDPHAGALVALAIAAPIVLVLQLAWFSAGNDFNWRANHVFYERYLFYVAPVLFAAGAAAVGRIRPRAVLAATAVAAVVVAGFSSEVVMTPFSYDAFGLTYLGFLSDAHEGWAPHVTLALVLLTVLLGLLLAAALVEQSRPLLARYARVLAVILPAFLLLLTGAKAWSYGWLYSQDSLALQPRPPGFAQPLGSGPIALLAADTTAPVRDFQAEFWNPRIDRVYYDNSPPVSSGAIFLNGCRFEWDRYGRVKTAGCGPPARNWYISAEDLSVRFRGQLRAFHGGGTRSGQLIELAGPPVLLAMTSGIDLDGRRAAGGSFTVWSFLRQRGRLRVLFAGGRAHAIELPVGRGPRKTRVRVSAPATTKVRAVQLREGRGPWLVIG